MKEEIELEKFFGYLIENSEDLVRINVFPHKQHYLQRDGADINMSRSMMNDIMAQVKDSYGRYVLDTANWKDGRAATMLSIEVFYYQPSRVCYENYEGHSWVETIYPFHVRQLNSRYDPLPNPFDLNNFIDTKRFCKRCGKDWKDR